MSMHSRDASEGPIGLFDSGIGGLTVLKALALALPHQSFIFLGDTARLPYGSKSPDTIRNYLIQNIAFLKSYGVSHIIVACNSASSVLDPEFHFKVPHTGVIIPGSIEAVKRSKSGRIGVVGTYATVSGGAYVREILKLNPQAVITQNACPLLVPLVEEGMDSDSVTETMVRRYCEPLLAAHVDTLVLGCTHYPVLKPLFEKVMGPDVALVDSAESITNSLGRTLKLTTAGDVKRTIRILVTDYSPTFERVGTRLLSPVHIDSFEWVRIG